MERSSLAALKCMLKALLMGQFLFSCQVRKIHRKYRQAIQIFVHHPCECRKEDLCMLVSRMWTDMMQNMKLCKLFGSLKKS